MTITETFIARSLSFEGDDIETALQSISFKSLDSESGIVKSVEPPKLALERSVAYIDMDQGSPVAINSSPSHAEDNVTLVEVGSNSEQSGDYSPSIDMPTNNHLKPPRSKAPEHLAALRLQKTYKSFRIRRQLADCAVLAEQRWLVYFTSLYCFLGIYNPLV